MTPEQRARRTGPRAVLALLVGTALVAGCGGEGQDATPGTPSATATSPSPTGTGPMAQPATCTSPAGFSISYPRAWHANRGVEGTPDCTLFDPAPLQVPQDEAALRAAISATVQDVAFQRIAANRRGFRDRAVTLVAGYQAARVEEDITGEDVYPDGTKRTSWYIGVGAGTAQGRPTLILNTVDAGAQDHATNVAVLDQMVRTLQITPRDGASPAARGVVARFDDNAGSFTVVAEVNGAQVCLRGVPATGDTPDDAPVTAAPSCAAAPTGDRVTNLRVAVGQEREVVAGLAGERVRRVEADGPPGPDGGRLAFLPVPVEGGDGAQAWVLPASPDQLSDVRSFSGEGVRLGAQT